MINKAKYRRMLDHITDRSIQLGQAIQLIEKLEAEIKKNWIAGYERASLNDDPTLHAIGLREEAENEWKRQQI